MTDYQHRLGGEIKYYSSLRKALRNTPYAKVSFDVDGGRLLLFGDGTWEYWDEDGVWSAAGHKPWFAEESNETRRT